MVAEEQLQQRLRALFAEELQDGLQLLGPGLLGLEADASQAETSELVRELFRSAHSLKGAAHAAGVPEAVATCDRLESSLAAVRDGQLAADSELVTRLLTDVDVLTAVAEELAAHGTPPPAAATSQQPQGAAPGAAVSPSPAPLAPTPASLRVSAGAVHEVLRQAGQGLAAARRLHEVVELAEQAAEQVEGVRARARMAFHDGRNGAIPTGLDTALDEAARAVARLARTVEASDRAVHHATGGVAEAAQRLRTQPFSEACSSLERAVRDVAAASGKAARLVVVGAEIDVDRAVIAALRDPLLHLVRNAVDHGIELPEARLNAGKPDVGTVEVVAALEGSLLHVTVRDDGGGVDLHRLREGAARRGIPVPADERELAFIPGLSSRTEVTAVSGRGVGLDAARDRVEQLAGSLNIASTPGSGTEVQLTTPVNLAVLRVLLVRAGQQVVALPTSTVDRVTHVDRKALREVDGAALLTLDRRSFHAVALTDALSFSRNVSGAAADQLGVVVPRAGEVVLVTDGLLDELEVAVQPVPLRLTGAPGVLGVAMIQAGLPVVVVNPVAVGRSAPPLTAPTAAEADAPAARILLAEDTITTRALERSILEAGGYSVAVAVDGADAWEQLQRDGADLVVSDVDMPRMSGIELCRRIRASGQLRDLPVVLVTSLDSTGDRQRGMEAGADAYVVKGELQQGSLLDTVARLL